MRDKLAAWWWDFKQIVLSIPRLFAALFIKPDHEGIESNADLVYQFGQAFLHIPSLLRRLAFKTRTLEEELHEAMLRGNMRKSFHGFDLLMLGLGIVVGSGVFKLTGQAQALYAGSALVISYLIAGIASICAAACFAELCVEYPVAGSAFTYVLVTFGEYPAFVTMGMLLIEYLLGMAAVARGFSTFLAQLIDEAVPHFALANSNRIDIMAFIIVLVMSALLSFGVRESTLVLNGATLLKLTLILGIVIAGFATADGGLFTQYWLLENEPSTQSPTNRETFTDGVFQGTAFIFFAYVAFDAVCNAVEETQRPKRIPGAIMGTVAVSMVTYILMSASLSMIVSPPELLKCVTINGDSLPPIGVDSLGKDVHVPANQCNDGYWAGKDSSTPHYRAALVLAYNVAYSVAFIKQGVRWMQYIVDFTALLGISTSLLVGLYSVARLVMVAARTWLLPPFLARISRRTQTPIVAQMVLGFIIAVVALFVRFTTLSDLVSVGALFAMWMVCNVVLYRRYYPEVKLRYTPYGQVEAQESAATRWRVAVLLSKSARRVVVWTHIVLINAMGIGCVVYYRVTLIPAPCDVPTGCDTGREQLGYHLDYYSTYWIVAGFIVTASMMVTCPIEYQPKEWGIKWWLLPWLPAIAIFLICFSAGAMSSIIFAYLGYYLAGITLVYIFFSMPMSYIRHFTVGPANAERLNVVELVFYQGKWMSLHDMTLSATAARSAAEANLRTSSKMENGSVRSNGTAGSGNSTTEGTGLRPSILLPAVGHGAARQGSRGSGSGSGPNQVKNLSGVKESVEEG